MRQSSSRISAGPSSANQRPSSGRRSASRKQPSTQQIHAAQVHSQHRGASMSPPDMMPSPAPSSASRVTQQSASSHQTSVSAAHTAARAVRRLQDGVNLHLNHYEKELLLDALNEFHSQRDMWGFVETLRTILNTPAKQQLVAMIRLVLPEHEISQFDKCIQISIAAVRGNTAANKIASNGNSNLRSSPLTPRSHSSRNSHRKETTPITSDTLTIKIQPDSTYGVGFTLHKSTKYGLPIFSPRKSKGLTVKSVVPGSTAFLQGLRAGQRISEINNISMEGAGYTEAKRIVTAARTLKITIQNSNSISGDSFELPDTSISYNNNGPSQEYSWVDSRGYACSPPPETVSDQNGTMRSSVSRRSGMKILSSQDERKINLRIEKGCGVGLTIRGGSEFKLGVYITGVDASSAAERAGILPGDQILDINGKQFLEISHKEAVKILKKSKHMMITVKHVGKLPHAKVNPNASFHRGRSTSVRRRDDPREGRETRVRYPGSLDRKSGAAHENKSVFTKGAGSQLMFGGRLGHLTAAPPGFQETGSHRHEQEVEGHEKSRRRTGRHLEERMKHVLNETERGTVRFYIEKYNKSHVDVTALVAALKELLNTQAKMVLLKDLKVLIHPHDVRKYEALVLEQAFFTNSPNRDPSGIPRSFSQMPGRPQQDIEADTSDFSLDSLLSQPSSHEELTNHHSNEDHWTSQTQSNHAHSSNPIHLDNHSSNDHLRNYSHIDERSDSHEMARPTSSRSSGRSSKARFVTDGSNKVLTTDVNMGSIRRKITQEDLNSSATADFHMDINPPLSDHLKNGARKTDSPNSQRTSAPSMGMRAAQINKTDVRSPSDDSGVDLRANQKLSVSMSDKSQEFSYQSIPVGSDIGGSGVAEDDQSSDDSSVMSGRRRSYRLRPSKAGSSDTDDDQGVRIIPQDKNSLSGSAPNGHRIQDTDGDVVLKSQRHIGTMPRNEGEKVGALINNNTMPTTATSFRDQIKSRQALSGKLYQAPPSPDLQEDTSPSDEEDADVNSESDYDTADILNISQQLRAASLAEAAAQANQENTPNRDEQSDRSASPIPSLPSYPSLTRSQAQSGSNSPSLPDFPPPPLSHSSDKSDRSDSNPASAQATLREERPRRSERDNVFSTASGIYEDMDKMDKSGSHETTNTDSQEAATPTQEALPPLPVSSPALKSRGKHKGSLYAVIKKSSGNQRAPVFMMSQSESPEDEQPPAIPAKLSNPASLKGNTDELIQVNKLKPTLGLAIEGGAGTKQPIPRIINIQLTGCAHNSGLKVGHVIKRINNTYLDGLTHNQAARTIADAFRDRKTGFIEFLVDLPND